MDKGSRPWARCEWKDCDQYVIDGRPVNFCTAHLTIITVHGLKDDKVSSLALSLARSEGMDVSPVERKHRPVNGHVYFLLSDNLVKIGWTSDLDKRMKQYSPGARILAVKPGTKDDEKRLHKKFADLKANRSEWFTYHPRVMEEVERIVAEHGDPPRELNEPMTTKKVVGPRLANYTQRRARSLNK